MQASAMETQSVVAATSHAGATAQCKKIQTGLQQFVDSPLPILELILIPHTSTQDKQALRRTCKLFLQVLDDSLACLKVHFNMGNRKISEKLINRLQPVHRLKTVVLQSLEGVSCVLKQLPDRITTLTITGYMALCLSSLQRLTCLTALNLDVYGDVTGLEHIYGLTKLRHRYNPIGSLAHLAPTLKHLSIWDCEHVQDLNKLTNLRELEVGHDMSPDFFREHSQLPLEHFCMCTSFSRSFFHNHNEWKSAPTTLTRLQLDDACTILPGLLPPTITHLQLLYLDANSIGEVAEALPGLKRLDLVAYNWDGCELKHLSKLASLQTLSMCIYNGDFSNRKICYQKCRR